MAGFYQWETKSFGIRLVPKEEQPEFAPLDGLEHIVVSIVQKGIAQVDLTEDDILIDPDESLLTIRLGQEQTGQFIEGKAKIQVNLYYENTERDTSAKGVLEVYGNLYEKVMS